MNPCAWIANGHHLDCASSSVMASPPQRTRRQRTAARTQQLPLLVSTISRSSLRRESSQFLRAGGSVFRYTHFLFVVVELILTTGLAPNFVGHVEPRDFNETCGVVVGVDKVAAPVAFDH